MIWVFDGGENMRIYADHHNLLWMVSNEIGRYYSA